MSSDQPNRRLLAGLGPLFTQGIQLALTVVVLFFIGNWLDTRWGTAPWLMLTGIFIGIVGGLIKFSRTAMQVGREEDAKDKSAPPHV